MGLKQIGEVVARRELTFDTGATYRRRLVTQSERRLTSLQILQFANIDAQPPAGPQVAAIPVTVTLTENPPRQLQLGVGYGSEERVRGSAQWSH